MSAGALWCVTLRIRADNSLDPVRAVYATSYKYCIYSLYVCFHTVYARRIFLSVNNPKPCFNETANLICHYPAVMERVNGQRRYRSFTPNWKRGETNIFPGADALYLNRTATQLTVRPNNFFNGSVQYTCFLLLRRGGEDSASIVLQPQGIYAWLVHGIRKLCA